jgi:hypothetical protein
LHARAAPKARPFAPPGDTPFNTLISLKNLCAFSKTRRKEFQALFVIPFGFAPPRARAGLPWMSVCKRICVK